MGEAGAAPGPGRRTGTEDVWQYPRPPAVVPSSELVVVEIDGVTIAETRMSLRVLETSHPPAYYLPREAFVPHALRDTTGSTVCEFKGAAAYFDVVGPQRVARAAAWTYPEPRTGFEALVDHVAVYPGRVGRCTVDGEVVQSQEGDFYGGWITSRVRGPFKGGHGTGGW
ncbi:MAG: DUF427 domain-containing protein [Aeromicrobium sp.]